MRKICHGDLQNSANWPHGIWKNLPWKTVVPSELCVCMSQVLRALITTMKEIGAKSAFTDGEVQSAKYVTCVLAVLLM